MQEEDPVSDITELVARLMSDAEAEPSLRQAAYPLHAAPATPGNEQAEPANDYRPR